MLPMEWVLLLAGLAAGAVLAWIFAGSRGSAAPGEVAEKNRLLEAARERETAQREKIAAMEATAGQLAAQIVELREALDRSRTDNDQLRRETEAARIEAARLRTALQSEQSGAAEKIAVLQQAREDLSNQFKALANDILEQKSKAFTEQNQTNLTTLLTPLKEKFGEFQQKVENLQKDGIAGRSELKTQIDQLRTLNERLSADATNLVNALKGSSKTQGDWGEFVLEKLLESAGLREGQEYRVQSSFTRDDRTRARPDVILDLPGNRHLVIDAKVSLGDYDEYCADGEEAARESALQRHIASMRNHIRELAQRNYQSLYGLNSLDFTILFVPIEPAFMLALAHDGKLWQEAWDRNVLLVSRTTLLFVLRTVAQLWRQEQQTRNVQEIVRRGGELYDKLAAFAKDLTDVGKNLEAARQSYDDAYRKLASGKGNAIRQAELLKSLGVRPTKSLPLALVEQAMDADEPLELAAVSEEASGPKTE
ncbi:MAG TPA: DNA recombination protein RmuC [Acidobacteriaceae bacterium]|nr:DNA recombination protein RmuC [Acidobacteriaceae bacterium]